MPRVEHQVLELVAFVHEDMVDAHLLEVRYIVRAVFYGVCDLFQLGGKVELTHLQPLQHGSRNILSLLFQHFKVFFHRVQLRLQDTMLQFGGLGNLSELVMRHDHTVVVIVPDIVEELDTVGSREVLLRGIKYPCMGISGSVALRNLSHVCFQTDNHRLMHQPQPLHLICRHAHDQCLACAHLVVTDTAAVLFEHPDTILLAGINLVYVVPSGKGLDVQIRKSLVRAVILRAHIAVELPVIHIRQPFLELRRLRFQPIDKPAADFVDFGIGKLYGFAVPHLDVVPVVVLADTLVNVRYGVVQGVFQEVDAVIPLVVSLHGKLLVNLHIPMVARDGKLVYTVHVCDFDVHPVQV